jgi:cytochrome bd-type quinol oxidase subunit 1
MHSFWNQLSSDYFYSAKENSGLNFILFRQFLCFSVHGSPDFHNSHAWMQNPVGFSMAPDGSFQLAGFWELLTNPWLFWQYVHNMSGAVVTASFWMSAVGAYYVLSEKIQNTANSSLLGVIRRRYSICIPEAFPSGDGQERT